MTGTCQVKPRSVKPRPTGRRSRYFIRLCRAEGSTEDSSRIQRSQAGPGFCATALSQDLIGSCGPDRTRDRLEAIHLSAMSNTGESHDRGGCLCPKCGKELGKGVTRCWAKGCDYVVASNPNLKRRRIVLLEHPKPLPREKMSPGESRCSAVAHDGASRRKGFDKKNTPPLGGCLALITIVVGAVLCAFFWFAWVAPASAALAKTNFEEEYYFPTSFIAPVMYLGLVLLGAAGVLLSVFAVITGFYELIRAILPSKASPQVQGAVTEHRCGSDAATGTAKERRLEELPAGELALCTGALRGKQTSMSVEDCVRAVEAGEIDPTDGLCCRESDRVITAGAIREAALFGGPVSVRKLFGLS